MPPTRRGIELNRVAHGPFEKMGLICLGIVGDGALPLRGFGVRPQPDNQCLLVGVLRVNTTVADYRQSPTINHSRSSRQ